MGDACKHLRRRLDRWALNILPGHRVQRALRVLEVLQRMTSPRVQASYLRTICDGWCTRRRFQSRGGCAFGCGRGEDSLSHFACCSVVAELFVNGIHLPGSRGPGALDVLLCMTSAEEEVAARGVGLYALYRLYNSIRYNVFQRHEFQDAFSGFVREGRR